MGVLSWRRGLEVCCSGEAGNKCGRGGGEQWSGVRFDRSQRSREWVYLFKLVLGLGG